VPKTCEIENDGYSFLRLTAIQGESKKSFKGAETQAIQKNNTLLIR